MSSKVSVEEVLSNLEQRAVFHREQEAFHAQQEVHHREQRAAHAAELAKVLESLEAFRAAAPAALELAKPVPSKQAPAPAAEEANLPPPGRLMVGRLLRLAVHSPELPEPFSPSAVAAEANRRFAGRLEKPIGTRTASDTLRQMLAEGTVQLARKGGAAHQALYKRRPRTGG
jgi:hypothetical protein